MTLFKFSVTVQRAATFVAGFRKCYSSADFGYSELACAPQVIRSVLIEAIMRPHIGCQPAETQDQ
jgi:hypothetical protein